MKKTYKTLSEELDQVTVEYDDGTEIKFLNGVMLMPGNEKFLAARGPVQGAFLLIIADYAYYHINSKEIEEWIDQFDGAIRQEGMVLTFDHDADRTAFLLRWG
jgi:hypothetical protein